LSSCTWYTPDFIIGNRLIVEVDGGIHDLDYHKTPDIIRQRALENMGYSVYRVRNKEVESYPFKDCKDADFNDAIINIDSNIHWQSVVKDNMVSDQLNFYEMFSMY